MYSVKIETDALKDIAAKAQAAPELLLQAVKDLAMLVVSFLTRQIVLQTPRNEGHLADSFFPELEQTSGNIVEAFVGVEGLASQYVWPVELGAHPRWPPPGDLIHWVEQKKLQFVDPKGRPMTTEQTAFVIGRSIAQHGTIARFDYGGAQMIANAVEKGDGQIDQITEEQLALFTTKLFS